MAYRVQHRFWFDVDKPDEAALNDLTVDLKRARKFQTTIRDGIRLVSELQQGRVGALLELYPWLPAALGAQARDSRPITTALPPANDDGLIVVKPAASNGESALNFLDSAFKLIQ